jgi:transcriptional regulator with XRE-family HTH domain
VYKLLIKRYRKIRRITQKELAYKIEISQNYLSELENNKYDIRLSLLCKIAKELNTSPKKLFIYK